MSHLPPIGTGGLPRRAVRLPAAATCVVLCAAFHARAETGIAKIDAAGLKREAAETATVLRKAIANGVAAGRSETTHVDSPVGDRRARATGGP